MAAEWLAIADGITQIATKIYSGISSYQERDEKNVPRSRTSLSVSPKT